jgi:(5-formylfuran-3-yl)methyl phosphate synthase
LAQLLVSVRSPLEARAAVAGGADIIDVKEPSRGSLGQADPAVWQSVRSVVPRSIPVSVALGELNNWIDTEEPHVPDSAWTGIAFCKLGLADAPADWIERWARIRHDIWQRSIECPKWVAVVYLDWQAAQTPEPDAIISAAIEVGECRVVLFDTWSKRARSPLDKSWKPLVERVQNSGRMVALAGSLDCDSIERLHAWRPGIFAVRGAACADGDRLASIESARVERLVEAARTATDLALTPTDSLPIQTSNRTP